MATKIRDNGQKAEKVIENKPTVISRLNNQTAIFTIVGTSPYVQNKFSNKAKEQMKAKQEAGGTAKKSTKRNPKDFKQCYEDAQYKPYGEKKMWPCGAIPATAIRAAMIAACRVCDFKMTEAKQCVFVEADGYDEEGIPLIKITKGEPEYFEQALRVANGAPDIRPRPMWRPGWEAVIRIRFDADRFTTSDVANLLYRAGQQCGIGEGRATSRDCVGVGWGEFALKQESE